MTEPISSRNTGVSGAAPTRSVPPANGNRTARHVLRTIIQVIVAEAAAIPSLAAAFNLSTATTAKVSGLVGGFVILVTAIQNASEDAGLIPTLFNNPVAQWVQQQMQQVPQGQPVVVASASSIQDQAAPGSPLAPDPMPGDVTGDTSTSEDPPEVQQGTPSAGNEVAARAPQKKTAAKKTAANSRRTRT